MILVNLAVVFGVLGSVVGENVREKVNFDFGWRHHLGAVPDPNRQCGQIEKGVNYGTGGTMHPNVTSADVCCDLCASLDYCVAWDLDVSVSQCWTKPTAVPKVTEDRIAGTIPPVTVPAPAKPGFNDSSWELVDTPHDMLNPEPYSEENDASQGFQARNVGWYRKHFTLPSDWKSSAVYFYTEGIFHETTGYLNGVQLGPTHMAGYTSFWLRLDNVTGVQFGAENVLALYVDASYGSGWWREGGGLARHNFLVRVNGSAHLGVDGRNVFPYSVDVRDSSASLVVASEVENDGFGGGEKVEVKYELYSESGELVTSFVSPQVAAPQPNATAATNVTQPVTDISLWSIQSPAMYTLVSSVVVDAVVTDSVNHSIGFRWFSFDANTGVYLNGEAVKARGFCDHSSFGGLGSAVPDRVNLFRTQTLRLVGGNAWRMAHNPPIPARLDFTDRLGVMVVDETREIGGASQQGGTSRESIAQQEQDLRSMMLRDRSHPSVFVQSLCNEVGCDNTTATPPFATVARQADWVRAVTQNHLPNSAAATEALDVQGFSHKSGSVFDDFHKQFPTKPLLATECCSSLSQRGVDEDTCPHPRPGGCTQGCRIDCNGNYVGDNTTGVFYNNEISESLGSQIAESDLRPFVGGTFVWSGFSYLGESRGWPQISKCRGTIADVAGFEKESAHWLRSWWLANISDSAKPPVLPDLKYEVRIVEAWIPGQGAAKGSPTRLIHVYSNAPFVELQVNGAVPAGGARQAMPFRGMVTFPNVTFVSGNLTAVALDSSLHPVASFTRLTPDTPTSIQLSLDAPSPSTGTGTAILADGEDTAMVRATIVDKNGNMVISSFANITFTVTNGPGRLWSTHNGDPANQVPFGNPTTPAYHGLARAYIRSTLDASTPNRQRQLQIDAETAFTTTSLSNTAPSDITVQATSPGLQSATLTIPVSTDPNDGPIPTASRYVHIQ